MQKEQSTYFYRIFEETLNLFRSKLTTTQVSTTNQINTSSQTPLEKSQQNFEKNLYELKKILPKIKGTKLYYMIQRYEKELKLNLKYI
jgi:hypothetical protein